MSLSTIIFLLLVILCWGVAAVFDKACLKYLDPSGAFYVRSLFMIVVLAPLVIWKYAQTKQALSGQEKLGPVFVMASVILSMAGVFFYIKALSCGAATKIVPLSSTYPLVTFLLALLLLGESFTLDKLVGTLLVSGGIYFICR